MFRTPQDDSGSDDEQIPTAHPFSMHQKPGYNHRAFDRPPLKTPFRPKCATTSSISSSSSSSTTSSVFDEGLMGAGTPLTPPIFETPDSSNADTPRLLGHGKLSTSSFLQRCMDTSHISSALPGPATTSTAKRTSQYLSDSDYELLVEGVENLGVQDHEQASNTKASLRLDKSPAPAGRTQLKKQSRQSVQGDDDCSQSPMENGVSSRKNQNRNTSGIDEMMSAELEVQRSLNPAGARGIPRSSKRKRKSAETPSLFITPIDGKGKEVDGDNPGATTQDLLHPVQYRQKVSRSAPRGSHKRSASAPGPHITSSRNVSPTQTYEVDETASLAPKCCSSRRRSASSVIPEHAVLPPTEFESPGDDKGVPGAFPNEPINFSKVGRQSPSEPPKRTPDLHPDETREPPKLEHKHPEKKNENDLKNEILRLIRRKKAKPAAESTPTHGYVYIFKSDRFPGYVKIGSTVNAPDIRIKDWGLACKIKTIQVTDKNDTAFRFCRIVEQIVHAELYNEQRIFYCDRCKKAHRFKMAERKKGTGGTELDMRPTEHGEWFEISETEALKVVNKWRNWAIHEEPYREDGTLLSRWIWKYDMGTKWMKGTEAEWEVWRHFEWLDNFRFTSYELNKWLGEVFPLLQKLVNVRGSLFVLGTVYYLGKAGVNLTSWLTVVTVLLLYWSICVKFC